MRRAPLPPLFAAALLAGLLAACQSGGEHVRLAFRPEPGSETTYQLDVRSRTTVRLGAEAPTHEEDDAVLVARHTVIASSSDGARVHVALTRAGSPTRTFVVRFDATGELAGVEQVEGLPVDVVGSLGLSELVPGAAAVPVGRTLQVGDRWEIDERVDIAGVDAGRLRGNGRLVRLYREEGRRLAVVTTTVELPLRRTTTLAEGTLALEGTQTTRSTTTYDVADGTVEDAEARTSGAFRLQLAPPAGRDVPPVGGRLVLDLRSETVRRNPG